MQSTDAAKDYPINIELNTSNTVIKLKCYDLPGREQYRVLNRMYLRDTNAAIICYDITKENALYEAEMWLQEMKDYAPSAVVIALCGCKSDMGKLSKVSYQDSKLWC